METPTIKVGDDFFVFDENKRVYESSYSAPTYRGHFVPVTIVGETKKSWVLNRYNQKAPKTNPWSILYTPEMIDDGEWENSHRYRLADKMLTATASQLRAIAEILEYRP